ncbi:MAG: thiol reductant ABC exporter subunit CydD, partial [Actinobacteria bacterium]|nr:thiol reductant ABC exporter subunit CydD [Actinomycetota bacterium]
MKPFDRRLLRHATAARVYIGTTTAAGVVLTALVVAQALLIAHVISPVIDGEAGFADVRSLILALGAVLATRVAVLIGQERFAHRAATRVIAELRGSVLAHAVAQGPRWLDPARSAEVVTLATRGLDDLGPYFVRYLPQVLLAAILSPVTLAVVFSIDLTSGLILLLALPLIPLFMWLVGRLTESHTEQRLAMMERLGGQVLDLLAGLATLKALGREHGPGGRVRVLADAYNATTLGALRIAFLSGAILEFIASISVALVAVVVGMRLVHGDLDLTTGLAAIMLAPEVLQPLRQVAAHFHASANGLAAATAAFEVLDRPAPIHGDLPAPPLARSSIELRDVGVRAPGRALLAPAHLDAVIEPGEITVVVGPTGAGKSTTALLLLALLRPDEGRVLLHHDGTETDLADVEPASLHRQVAWVPQRPAIVPGTVAANVAGAVTPAVERAAALAGFDAAALPAGWDTRVG